MTSKDPVISELTRANPVALETTPGLEDRAQAERVFDRVVSAPPPPPQRRWPIVAPVLSAVVVVVVVVVALSVHGSRSTHAGTPTGGGSRIVLLAEPTAQQPVVTKAAIARAIVILRERLNSVAHGFSVTSQGANQLLITTPKITADQRLRIIGLLTRGGQLYFYDWEANAMTPNGRPVSAQLRDGYPPALAISQGTSTAAPGQPTAGGLPLYQAVKLAARQPKSPSANNAQLGVQYYLFGAPGSAACTATAKTRGVLPVAGQHCLLAGPENESASMQPKIARRLLDEQGSPAIRASEGQLLVVRQGTVVLQAANPTADKPIKFADGRFFVLHDDVALNRSDITTPRASTDSAGNPTVQFGFNSAGRTAFEHVTRRIALRGQDISTLGMTLDQHFAVALDNQLLTVPSIDYRAYPDGITGGNGADITGGLTVQSAQDLATELRYGPLPLQLRLIHPAPTTGSP